MTDLAADLDQYDDDLPEPEGLDEPCPPPDDAEQADRYCRRLSSIAQRRAEVKRLASARLERIEQWAADTDRPLREGYEWLERAVAGWARAVNRQDPKRKTIKLPFGEVTVREARPSIEAPTDDATLQVIAAYRPEMVRTTLTPNKGAMHKGGRVGEQVAIRSNDDGTEVAVFQVIVGDKDPETGEVLEMVLPGVHVVLATTPTVKVRVES